MIATIRMMKGVDRTKLTIVPAMRLKTGRSRNCPGAVTTNAMPSGKPIRVERIAEAATIMIVCLSDSSSRLTSAGESRSDNMAEHLSMQIERSKICEDVSKIRLAVFSDQRHDSERLSADIIDAPMQDIWFDTKALNKCCHHR